MSYELIETVEVGAGGAASIEFTSIPQDGTDLVLKVSARSNFSSDSDQAQITINNDTGANYNYLYLRGSGSGVATGLFSSENSLRLFFFIDGDNATANTFGNGELLISNYAGSSAKSISADLVTEKNATTTAYQLIGAALWDNTNAVTSIQFEPRNGTLFLEHSTFSLYKITAA